MSCHWWLLVWSHLWRWRQLRSQHAPTVDSVIAWGTQFISLLFPLRLCGCMSALVVNLCFAKVCGISMSFTPHLLTIKGISQSLKDFIGIVFFFFKGILILPSTIFHHRKMRQRWSKWRQQLLRPWNNGIVRTVTSRSVSRPLPSIYGRVDGEHELRNWGSDPRHSWGALSGKPSSVNLHDLRVSATVILYVLCMHVHALHCITYHETFKRM